MSLPMLNAIQDAFQGVTTNIAASLESDMRFQFMPPWPAIGRIIPRQYVCLNMSQYDRSLQTQAYLKTNQFTNLLPASSPRLRISGCVWGVIHNTFWRLQLQLLFSWQRVDTQWKQNWASCQLHASGCRSGFASRARW